MTKQIHFLSNKNLEDLTGDCAACGRVALSIARDRGATYYRCINGRRASDKRFRFRDRVYLTNDGREIIVTGGERQQLNEKFGNVCGICDKDGHLMLDHCHTTGKIRGLLCNNCNLGLGNFKDSLDLLDRAKRYLEHS